MKTRWACDRTSRQESGGGRGDPEEAEVATLTVASEGPFQARTLLDGASWTPKPPSGSACGDTGSMVLGGGLARSHSDDGG